MELLSAIEVARLVGRSERTVRNWLERGELQAEKLHGVWRIERAVALRVAEDMARRARATPAPSERATEGLVEALNLLVERVAQLEAKVERLEAVDRTPRVASSPESHVASLEGAGGGWSASRSSVQGWGSLGDASAFSARHLRNSSGNSSISGISGISGGNLPRGLVSWRPFVRAHGIHHTTVIYRVQRGEIPVVSGNWKQGRTTITQAFDANGQREFWRAYHNHPAFVPCERCPHTLPTLPVDPHALDGVPEAALAEFEGEAGE